jgi:division protein CdvB (Snf7/Vps24/ESCRT-III family)
MKQTMNLNAVRRILFVFYAMFLSLTAAAQNLTSVLGTVTDENGDPVSGASVELFKEVN